MANKSTFNIDFFLNLHLILNIKNAIPDHQINSLQGIKGILEGSDIEAIIFDIDQTIVPFGGTTIPEEIQQLIRSLQPKYRMCFLSNFPHTEDRIKRIHAIEGQLEIHAIFSERRKPSPAAFRLALEYLGSEPKKTMMVGDRVLTDIIGANQLGLQTVLVAPLDKKTDPFFMVTLPRFFERPYLKLGRFIHKSKS
ncbi:MAG TPA: HAD-IA family hydrolase [Candidatus Heimdallarchaeota archaeon]|nr:HAD-IA family hydrolase [Candidatus Heimdallarchaeota archaeon]